MIEEVHVQPQPLSDLINRGVKLGGLMFKKVSILFYIITIVYFLATFYLAEFLGFYFIGDVFLTFVNLSYSFFVTAYLMRIMMRESDEKKAFGKWTFLKLLPILVIASFLYWLMFVLGSLLLIVPGILFFLYFLLFPSVIVIEQKSLFHSFKRSAQLVKGSFFRVALVYMIFLGVQAFGIIVLSFFMFSEWVWLTALIAAIIHILILPFQATILNLLYFELRAEREAFDFEVFEYEARRQLTA